MGASGAHGLSRWLDLPRGAKRAASSISSPCARASDDPEAEQDLAAVVDEEDRSFASLPLVGATTYYQELARRKVIAIAGGDGGTNFTEGELHRLEPYLWQHQMAADRYMANAGEWACKRLVGKRAALAGGALRNRPRSFGVHLARTPGQSMSVSVLRSQLRRCGERLARVSVTSSRGEPTPEQNETLIERMRQDGVTTLICLCYTGAAERGVVQAATERNYVPEWITPTWYRNSVIAGVNVPPQVNRRFGLSGSPMILPPEQEPALQAAREIDPTYGEHLDNDRFWTENVNVYRAMLLLASGIQMAGPNLTPRTFADGFHQARFPNPPDPRQPGKVGFSDGDHSMINDAAQVYFDRRVPGPYASNQRGSTCYLQLGERHSLGRWHNAGGQFYRPPASTSGIRSLQSGRAGRSWRRRPAPPRGSPAGPRHPYTVVEWIRLSCRSRREMRLGRSDSHRQ